VRNLASIFDLCPQRCMFKMADNSAANWTILLKFGTTVRYGPRNT